MEKIIHGGGAGSIPVKFLFHGGGAGSIPVKFLFHGEGAGSFPVKFLFHGGGAGSFPVKFFFMGKLQAHSRSSFFSLENEFYMGFIEFKLYTIISSSVVILQLVVCHYFATF